MLLRVSSKFFAFVGAGALAATMMPSEVRAQGALGAVPPALLNRARTHNLSEADSRTLTGIALELIRNQHHLEARRLLEYVCTSRFARAKDYVYLGRSYVDELGDTSSSNQPARLLKKALQMDPNCSEAYVTLSTLSLLDGDSAKALEYANRAIACPQRDNTSFVLRAKVLAATKRYKEALESVADSERTGYTHAEVYRIKGSLLENLGRYDEAVVAYRKGHALQKKDWTIFQIVRCLEMQKKFADAIKELDGLIAVNPSDGEAFRIRAQLKIKCKNLKGALDDMNRTISLEPSVQGYKERAKLFEMMGKPELARKDIDAAKDLSGSPF